MPTSATIGAEYDPAINLARESLYRFAALSLLDPRAGAWDQLHSLRDDPVLYDAAALLREDAVDCPHTLAVNERPLADFKPQAVLNRLPDSPAKLNERYEQTFGLLVAKTCPPYETEYINGKLTFQRSNALADIAGFYRAFGLATADLHPERPDHIVLELEFMAVLLELERRAAESSDADRAERAAICREAQQRFVREHLAWWAPAFGKLLGREEPNGFYAAAGRFLAALIPVERAILQVPPPVARDVTPSPLERPEECEGCALAP